MSNRWIYDCLTTVPANDWNFKSALERARKTTLKKALEQLKEQPKGNGSRMVAIIRELRRREKSRDEKGGVHENHG